MMTESVRIIILSAAAAMGLAVAAAGTYAFSSGEIKARLQTSDNVLIDLAIANNQVSPFNGTITTQSCVIESCQEL